MYQLPLKPLMGLLNLENMAYPQAERGMRNGHCLVPSTAEGGSMSCPLPRGPASDRSWQAGLKKGSLMELQFQDN